MRLATRFRKSRMSATGRERTFAAAARAANVGSLTGQAGCSYE